MKSKIFAIVLVSLFTVVANIQAQDQPPSAAETVETLRAQLFDVQAREDELRSRAQQLDEALKPENIERSLAGVGSTRPEELRESRRKQLTIQRDSVLAQLRILGDARVRLESALGEAQARAYQQSARQVPTQAFVAQSLVSTRWLIAGGVGLFALAVIAGLFIYQRAVRLR